MEYKAWDSDGREWKQVRFAPRQLFNLSVLALPLHGSIRLRRQATFAARLLITQPQGWSLHGRGLCLESV